jgi:hypothetical protein
MSYKIDDCSLVQHGSNASQIYSQYSLPPYFQRSTLNRPMNTKASQSRRLQRENEARQAELNARNRRNNANLGTAIDELALSDVITPAHIAPLLMDITILQATPPPPPRSARRRGGVPPKRHSFGQVVR